MVDGEKNPLKVDFEEYDYYYLVRLADKIVYISKGKELIKESIAVDVPYGQREKEVVFAGVQEGYWNVYGEKGDINFNCIVDEGRNTLSFTSKGGKFIVKPGRSYQASESVLDTN